MTSSVAGCYSPKSGKSRASAKWGQDIRFRHRALSLMLLILIGAMCVEASDNALYDATYDDANAPAEQNQNSPCDDKFCEPQFVDLASQKRVIASSTCVPTTDVGCAETRDPQLGLTAPCIDCQYDQPKKEYRADYLTDRRSHSRTCWASKSFRGSKISHVNLTINFEKKHIIHYMSLTDCGRPLPDNLEVLKSVDYGETWQRWQLFSKNCKQDFNITGKIYHFTEQVSPKELVCTIINDNQYYRTSSTTLSFSPAYNRQKNRNNENDPVYFDWMTATDIKIVMQKYPENKDFDKPISFSEIAIGGRCFCNGHASRCIQRNERQVCDCMHGTVGDDCERCRDFWVDLPWRRGTYLDPFQCKPCNCNKHSETCRFSTELYKSTNFVSGGVCVNCRDNTQGHHCDECMNGFYRNSSLRADSPNVCLVCNCHPLGSISQMCDKKTGKCSCKTGIIGKNCDICSHGYKQTGNQANPCVKIDSLENELAINTNSNEKLITKTKNRANCPARCRSDNRTLTWTDYCIREWVLVVRILDIRNYEKGIIVKTKLEDFKCHSNCHLSSKFFTLWINKRNWRCDCPKVEKGNSYIIVTREKRHPKNNNLLVLDKRSIVWKKETKLLNRIKNFDKFVDRRADSCQDCDCVKQKQQQKQLQRRKQKQKKKRPQLKQKPQLKQQKKQQKRKNKRRKHKQGSGSSRTALYKMTHADERSVIQPDYTGKGGRYDINSDQIATFSNDAWNRRKRAIARNSLNVRHES